MDHHEPRGTDRRQAPRRAVDTQYHYAREALVDAALALADAQTNAMLAFRLSSGMTREERAEASAAISVASNELRRAAVTYRIAEEARGDVPRGTSTEVAAYDQDRIESVMTPLLELSPDLIVDPATVTWTLVAVSVPMDPPGVYGDEALVRVKSSVDGSPVLTVRYDGTIEQPEPAR